MPKDTNVFHRSFQRALVLSYINASLIKYIPSKEVDILSSCNFMVCQNKWVLWRKYSLYEPVCNNRKVINKPGSWTGQLEQYVAPKKH